MNALRSLSIVIPAGLLIATAAAAQDLDRGKALYDRWCAGCHGVEGDGQGPAADRMLPQPRDFTTGAYQIRMTASGAVPTDEDLIRIIEEGMPGTAMPGWSSKFSSAQTRDIVAYLKTFSRAFQRGGTPEPLEFGRAPGRSEEALAEGREFYERIECWKCHGQQGRGDGQSAPTLQDDLDFPVVAADLKKNWRFNGGGSVEAIYRRLRTGLNGTPMPSFSDLIDAEFMTEEQLWNLAQYVRSLAPERTPRVREVVRAALVEGELPDSPDDSIWNEAERFYFPLVGQIIEEPRWFEPRVVGVWVSALHDGEELAMRISWTDPSRSPNPAWREWQERVLETLYPSDDTAGAYPDRLVVQFPAQYTAGRERPYFLMGDSRRPVYLWSWSSEPEGVREMRATGLGTDEPLAGATAVASSAVWEAGEWRVQLRRSLATVDSVNKVEFITGEPIPVAFYAWDGSNGETGNKMSISSWYSIYLETPTPPTVYISPIVAIVLTAGLGLFVVWRAQNRYGNETA